MFFSDVYGNNIVIQIINIKVFLYRDFEREIFPKNFSENSHYSAASNDQIIMAQEAEEPVDECDA